MIEYICPACAYLGFKQIITGNKELYCTKCSHSFISETDSKKALLFKTFMAHDKKGFKCPSCKRFIPKGISNDVVCPYFDCCYIGNTSLLNKMSHPTTNINAPKTLVSVIEDNKPNDQFKSIKEIIENQKITASYNSHSSTIKHKQLIYDAYLNLMDKNPEEMSNYLLNGERFGFQHKIFQEYIKLLEKSLPIFYVKRKEICVIDSLLDEKLNIFSGLSTFESIITDKLEIKNNTQEFYVGGRMATCSRPYYIGKLLDVMDVDNKASLMNNVKEYSFLRIKLENVQPGVRVCVRHLMIVPHYSSGAMSSINRIKQAIVGELRK